jgi:hypothetical protein
MPVPKFTGNISFNAQHSPAGAFFSFTCGLFGSRGGFGLELGRPGDQNLYIGVKEGDRLCASPLRVLPFYEGSADDEARRFQVEQANAPAQPFVGLLPYRADEISRHYGFATDRWVTRDLDFAIHTPVEPIDEHAAPIPAITAELRIDNRAGKTPRTAVFAVQFPTQGTRLLQTPASRHLGFAQRRHLGVAGCIEQHEGPGGRCILPARLAMRWQIASALRDPSPVHHLGNTPALVMEVPAGAAMTLHLALACHRDDIATTGLAGRYAYTRRFACVEEVLDAALQPSSNRRPLVDAQDDRLASSRLSPSQQFLVAHSTRSYFGSTQLLDVGGEPFWVVNEGEYCMMNTLDLAVDHVFFELRHNPWVVRNLLDRFARHYAYVDQVKVPKASALAALKASHVESADVKNTPRTLGTTLPLDHFDLKPGGISFTHDMGVHNNFSPPGCSSYELPDLVGCFSHMTAEQLCNWSLMAACYVAHTADSAWASLHAHTLEACLQSLINRGPDTGTIEFDSSRCATGSEITTYDSLDHSLAQTRNNVYMAVKAWATALGLGLILHKLGRDASAHRAFAHAAKASAHVIAHAGPDGVLPAVFEPDNPGYHSRILPACEGLIYPQQWLRSLDPSDVVRRTIESAMQALVPTLRRHTVALLTDPQQRNLFPDGGLRLSSTSGNSWMSKIALFQHICRTVFALDTESQIRSIMSRADAAHVRWQTEGKSAYWACSDQIVHGVAEGSKYYPRIVTTVLWQDE